MNMPTSKKELLTALIEGTAKLRREIVDFLSNKSKIDLNVVNLEVLHKDESIIDVTGKTYKIEQNNETKTKVIEHSTPNKIPVPSWAHQYVYSFSEINGATRKQKEFYYYFKERFLDNEFIDLDGNSNYAFILLFDLLGEFDKHRNIVNLEIQFQRLGQFYPKTKSYAVSFLARKMEAEGDLAGAARVNYEYQNTYYDYWNLGNKYKTELNLKDDEVKILNKVSYPGNNFCNIKFCCIEVIKFYLFTIRKLDAKYALEATSLTEEASAVADLVARKNFRYKLNSQNYHYCIESTSTDIYSNIFKYCENAVREFYGHKRKLSTININLSDKSEYEARIAGKVKEIIAESKWKFALPDEKTEIELNTQTPTRWKIKFDGLAANYSGNAKLFIEDILQLGKLNRNNSSIENIFFEASKFISKYDRESSLILYIYYLYYDLKSASFDNKQFTKTIQKNLFKTNDQFRDFEVIVSEFVSDRNLEKALRKVAEIYIVKRKKIQLDSTAIKEVQQQHAGTVELLNEFLQDEFENEVNTIKSQEVNKEEIEIKIIPKSKSSSRIIFTDQIAFTDIHLETLSMFSKNNLSLLQTELEIFAKSKGAFKNQLIDSLNEICYEALDDVLIEEEDEHYTINENHYQTLLAK